MQCQSHKTKMRVDAARVFAPGCASARILLVCDWRLY
nr:MAG TPA: hypothetical protein [Caudoviricetes sp.]DAY39363.1 MAG TPA: hypothetical protein [Caudoviricetes sp.]